MNNEGNVQKINIEVDGVMKVADVIKVFAIDDKEYVVYSIDKNGEESDILASEIVKDENGYDQLVDITDPNAKKNVIELVNIMFS